MNATTTSATPVKTSKTWTADEIREKIATDDKWLTRGLLAIYDRQTADEQRAEQTNHDNGIGFNGADAPILSSLAKWQRSRGYLSPKQVALARKRMRKYGAQLARIANGEM